VVENPLIHQAVPLSRHRKRITVTHRSNNYRIISRTKTPYWTYGSNTYWISPHTKTPCWTYESNNGKHLLQFQFLACNGQSPRCTQTHQFTGMRGLQEIVVLIFYNGCTNKGYRFTNSPRSVLCFKYPYSFLRSSKVRCTFWGGYPRIS
jgi:hypothetical protein